MVAAKLGAIEAVVQLMKRHTGEVLLLANAAGALGNLAVNGSRTLTYTMLIPNTHTKCARNVFVCMPVLRHVLAVTVVCGYLVNRLHLCLCSGCAC